MPSDFDLAQMFPALANQLENWDGRQMTNDGSDDPSHAGVTGDDVENYLRQTGSLRAPLSPAVSGQAVPPTPEFANNGRAVPPGGTSYMEPPQSPVSAEPPAPIMGDEAEGGEAVTDEGEQEVSGPTSAPPPPPDYVELAGRRYDRAQAEAWAVFDQMVESDPQLRQLLSEYLQKRTRPQTPIAAPSAPSQPLPDLPPEYQGDETIMGLHRALQAQQEAIDAVRRQAANAESIASHQVQRTYSDIAQGAISEFQKARQLDDDTMAAVSRVARQSGFAEKYMQGVDPITGARVNPDPYKAVYSALEAGYFMAPETREVEISRAIDQRAARIAEDKIRKEKLGGVSGASGSVPRTQTVPQNPRDSKAALLQEVTQMMNGSWAGDGS